MTLRKDHYALWLRAAGFTVCHLFGDGEAETLCAVTSGIRTGSEEMGGARLEAAQGEREEALVEAQDAKVSGCGWVGVCAAGGGGGGKKGGGRAGGGEGGGGGGNGGGGKSQGGGGGGGKTTVKPQ